MLSKLLLFGTPAVALLMLFAMILPAGFWYAPATDATYKGFDRNLIYVNEYGDAPERGIVEVLPESIKLTAVPGSQPTVDLLTTPLSFKATMDVRILNGTVGATPLRIGVWSPRNGSGYFLDFGPVTNPVITAQTIARGIPGRTLIGGEVTKQELVGRYVPKEPSRLEFDVDKLAGTIHVRVAIGAAPPIGSAMLRLDGGPADPRYEDVISDSVPVTGGKEYRFGGSVKVLSGFDSYKIAVQWLDANHKLLGFFNDWRSVQELHGWTERGFVGTAPQEAAFARLNLGSGNETSLVFAGLFVKEVPSNSNLLRNGDFRQGSKGWMFVGRASTPLRVIASDRTFQSSVTRADAPDLLSSLRLSLTASALSRAGVANSIMEDYQVLLPHQRWQVVKTADRRATGLLVFLLTLGGILILFKTAFWMSARHSQDSAVARTGLIPYLHLPVLNHGRALTIATAISAFLIGNALLFSLGSLPFDMTAAKVWSYVATRHGPRALYWLPNLVSLAKVWNGIPYHEAVFPYHPPVAYYFTFIGWLHKLFFNGPGPLLLDTNQMELLIKGFNVIFGLADAVLIYLIMQEMKVGQHFSRIAAGVFLFNPAVWFSMSVLGATHVVSVFFLLLAIWLAERRSVAGTWAALTVASLTRPQMLVPAFLLGLVLFRKFSLKENTYGIAWTIIIMFMVSGPVAIATGPSVLADITANQFVIHEMGKNEPVLTTVTLEAYSIWPLVSYLAGGAHGLSRFYYPSLAPLIGTLSYLRVSQILVMGIVLGSVAFVYLRGRGCMQPCDYLPLLTVGTLGFLIAQTGIAPMYFIIGLPLLILCRKVLTGTAWGALVGVLTLTTLVSMYGSFGFAISAVGSLAPALHQSHNFITQFVMNLHSADWFITLSVVANMFVVSCLALLTLPWGRARQRPW